MTAVLVMQWRSGGKSCDLPGSWHSQGALRWRQSWKRAKIRSLVHEVADPPPQVRESFSEVSFVSAGPSVRFEAVCSRFRLRHDTGAGRGAASWALGHHKAPSCCWSGGPQPEGNRISEPLDLDALSHPLSCMSCRVPAKVYNRAPSIAAAGVESGCALRGES